MSNKLVITFKRAREEGATDKEMAGSASSISAANDAYSPYAVDPSTGSIDAPGTTETSSATINSLIVQQQKVLDALRAATATRQGLTLTELADAAGVETHGNNELLVALSTNPKVEVRMERYCYKTKYDARDKFELIRLINTLGDRPLAWGDLVDLYPSAESDLDTLTRCGDIIRVHSVDTMMDDSVYSRDMVDALKVRLSGTLTLTHGSATVKTSGDLTSELFRNDLLLIEGKPFRVSSEVVGGFGFQSNARRSAAAAAAGSRRRTKRKTDGSDAGAGADSVASDGNAANDAVGDEHDEDDDEGDDEEEEEEEEEEFRAGDGGGSGYGSGYGGGYGSGAGAGAASSSSSAAGAAGAGSSQQQQQIAYPPTGIYYVSTGNFVKTTGGHFSAADTAPHRLGPGRQYSSPFSSSSLPLDRPWDGPTRTGVVAYKFGATGDLRVLWREVVHHGRLLQEAAQNEQKSAAAIAAAAWAGSVAANVALTTASTAESLLLSLGGADAFKSMKAFPASHRELRDELSRLNLDTKMAPGCLDSSLFRRTDAEKEAARRQKKARKTDRRALQLTTADHLDSRVREAVQKAAIENVRKQIETNLASTRR